MVPDPQKTLHLNELEKIESVCTRFEQSWPSLQIEEVLAEAPESSRAELLRLLLLVEFELSARDGLEIDPQTYLARFPDHQDVVQSAIGGAKERGWVSGTYNKGVADTVDMPAVADTGLDDTIEHKYPSAAATSTPQRGQFGQYELLEEIARGGMGVVYKARQAKANRIVALKMILSGQLAGEDEVRRFYTEAEAAAALDHPSIVPIFDVGQQDGQHYFSMGFVAGQSLADRIREEPLPPRAAAEIVKTIAEAVHYAHQNGIIHRDLKPANVLLDGDGNPRVTDFGLAKQVGSGADLTATGQVMGTPSYMPPEQALGKISQLGPAADIYSLGAILYATLTGRPPFQAASMMEILRQVIAKEPVEPRVLNPTVDRDLETICLKCLQKEPGKRYPTADELAKELDRYLHGEPIEARPVGRPERTWRWCKRNPVVATISMLLALAIVAGTVLTGFYAAQANAKATDLAGALEDVDLQRSIAQDNESRAVESEHRTRQLLYDSDMFLAGDAFGTQRFPRLETLLTRHVPEPGGRDYRGFAWYCLRNLSQLPKHEIEDLQREMPRLKISPNGKWLAITSTDTTIELRDFRSQEVVGTLSAPNAISCFVWSADSDRIISGHVQTNASVRIWDVASRTEQHTIVGDPTSVTAVAIAPDNSVIVSGTYNGQLRIHDLDDLSTWTTPILSETQIESFAFSRHNDYLAVIGQRTNILHVYDVGKREVVHTLDLPSGYFKDAHFTSAGTLYCGVVTNETSSSIGKAVIGKDLLQASLPVGEHATGGITCLALSNDETRLAAGFWNGQVVILDAEFGGLVTSLPGHSLQVTSLAFSDDDTKLLSASLDRSIKFWDLSTNALPSFAHTCPIDLPNAASVSYDGTKFAITDKKGIVVRDVATSAVEYVLTDAPLRAMCVSWSRDGKYLVAAGEDGTACVWDTFSREVVARVQHSDGTSILTAAFSPESKQIAIAGDGGLIDVWNMKGQHEFSLKTDSTARIDDVVFLQGEPTLIASCADAVIRIWDLGSRECRQELTGHQLYNVQIALFPGEKLIASSSWDKSVRVWDIDSGMCIREFHNSPRGIFDVAVSPDGGMIAICNKAGTIVLIDAQTGEPLVNLRGDFNARGVAFSQLGPTLFSWHSDGLVRVWRGGDQHERVNQGSMDQTNFEAFTSPAVKEQTKIAGHTAYVRSVAFSPDGNRIVSGSNDTTVKIWNADTGGPLLTFEGHSSFVTSVAFDYAGQRVVSGSIDGELKIWNAENGRQIHEIKAHEGSVTSVAFSPNAQTIASCGSDGVVKTWDADQGSEIRTFEGHKRRVNSVAFRSDGKRIVSGSGDRTLKLWDVKNGRVIRTFKGHTGGILSVAFDPNGKLVASGSNDGTIKIWDAEVGGEIGSLEGHSETVYCVAFSPDGGRIVSGGLDQTVRIWDVAHRELIRKLTDHTEKVYSVAFSPSGKWIISGSADRTIQVCDAPTRNDRSDHEQASQGNEQRPGLTAN